MSKPLDPNGLAGAFAKGPPTSLDFLVPAKPKPKAKAKAKAKAKPKTKSKPRAKAKAKTAPRAVPVVIVADSPVIARDVWTPGAPPPAPSTFRGRVAWRIERLVGKVLYLVLP